MKTASTKDLPFNSLPTDEYMKYINRADHAQSLGLHQDKDVIELAEYIYEKELQNESNISEERRTQTSL